MTRTISIFAQTYGAPYAARFLTGFRMLANELGADFVIVGDGEAGELMARRFADTAVRFNMQHTPEEGIRPGAEACQGEMILRFDDDETISPAMRKWILEREWAESKETIFSFPYAWLWGDENHFITSAPFWPDPHARLMPKVTTMRWQVTPHAGNVFGLGKVVPVAHCHHKFLVQSEAHRYRHGAKLEGVGPGLGFGTHFGKFMFPERFCTSITVHELGNGLVGLENWVDSGERIRFI